MSSHRTRHLPPAHPVVEFVRRLRYHEASRQILGFVLIGLFAAVGRPESRALFACGALAVLLGTAFRLWASGYVKKNKTLATGGPYALVRHPLYLGNILILGGFVLAAQWWPGILVLAAFLWFYYPPAIDYEDRKLERLFGEVWREWRARTRALWPRRPRGAWRGAWSWRQSLLDNGEPLIAAVVLAALWWLWSKLPAA